jgi:hypothetical protein
MKTETIAYGAAEKKELTKKEVEERVAAKAVEVKNMRQIYRSSWVLRWYP